MKKFAWTLLAASTLLITTPVSLSHAQSPTPVQSVAPVENSPQGGDDHHGPKDRIREEEHGFEGAGIFLVGGAVVIAVGLAFLIGRRSNKSK
jgi:hypothetical protein